MKRGPHLGLLAGLTTLAAACAVGGFALFSTLSQPPGASAALAAIDKGAGAWSRALAAPAAYPNLGEQAICGRADQAGAIAMDEQVQDAARGAAIQLGDVTVIPTGEKAGRFAVVGLKLHAAGPVDKMQDFLVQLAGLQPAMFVDIADLRQTPQEASLDLSGRVLCQTS
ncbi:MAG: hypothetical protein JWM33_1270 [Caulobacteraceae bacterium]|nr:hypothetical protein [Caulobacteraceae bacterium]